MLVTIGLTSCRHSEVTLLLRKLAINIAAAIAVPPAALWIGYWERKIRATGIALDPSQLADARAVEVAFPERVRLLRVHRVPFPRWAGTLAKLAAAEPAHTAGLTARYGIFIRADHWGDRALLLHELVHTAQYERLNGIRPFLRQYVRECLSEGYGVAALEREASAAARRAMT